jgi:acyl carrier protein
MNVFLTFFGAIFWVREFQPQGIQVPHVIINGTIGISSLDTIKIMMVLEEEFAMDILDKEVDG